MNHYVYAYVIAIIASSIAFVAGMYYEYKSTVRQKERKEKEMMENERLRNHDIAYDKVWQLHQILEDSGIMKYDSNQCTWVAVKVKK